MLSIDISSKWLLWNTFTKTTLTKANFLKASCAPLSVPPQVCMPSAYSAESSFLSPFQPKIIFYSNNNKKTFFKHTRNVEKLEHADAVVAEPRARFGGVVWGEQLDKLVDGHRRVLVLVRLLDQTLPEGLDGPLGKRHLVRLGAVNVAHFLCVSNLVFVINYTLDIKSIPIRRRNQI